MGHIRHKVTTALPDILKGAALSKAFCFFLLVISILNIQICYHFPTEQGKQRKLSWPHFLLWQLLRPLSLQKGVLQQTSLLPACHSHMLPLPRHFTQSLPSPLHPTVPVTLFPDVKSKAHDLPSHMTNSRRLENVYFISSCVLSTCIYSTANSRFPLHCSKLDF